MNSANKIESMLELMFSDTYEILSNNLGEATQYASDVSIFDDSRDLFALASQNHGECLSAVLNASLISDVFYIIVEAILADGEVEHHELQAAADLLKCSLHRYSWLEGYERCKYVVDADDMQQLLAAWQNDPSWLGGDHNNGALIRPFNNFAILSCFVSASTGVYQLYVKCTLLVAKLVLEAGGVASTEQDFYDSLAASLRGTEDALMNMNVSHSNDSLSRPKQEAGLTRSDTTITPDEALSEGLSELQSLVGV